ncbi:MAG TPA: DeoR/GlpR family DNA-binding transcription regulator [Acidimicrobiales bacterium]|nr:DeoR/GlpR family DNA-binding transcription regulator [Acidimicrobiales bacterium]
MSIIQGTLASEERLHWLSEQLAEHGAVTIAEAAASLNVSEMTIRRALAELEERGTARRVRGGARALGPRRFEQRRHTATRAKAKIAAKLARLLPASGAVAFDASSTIMRLSAAITDARDLTVLTNGLETFTALQQQPGVSPLLTGGRLDSRTGSLVGPLACRTASHLAVDVFFSSAAAVEPALGALEATLEDAELKRSIAEGAEQVVLAVDAGKLGQRALAVGIEWEQVDLLVTDLEPEDDQLEQYRALTRVV